MEHILLIIASILFGFIIALICLAVMGVFSVRISTREDIVRDYKPKSNRPNTTSSLSTLLADTIREGGLPDFKHTPPPPGNQETEVPESQQPMLMIREFYNVIR